MHFSHQIGALVGALALAQQEIDNPALDSVNPHFKNRYASLAAHLEAVRKPLSKHGLILTQGVSHNQGMVVVTTMIAHSSGEWISSAMEMPMPDRATAQQIGSIVTYLRRYSLASLALITGDEEDDAETDRAARTAPKPVTAKPVPAPVPAPAPAPAPAAASAPAKTDMSVFSPSPKNAKGKKWSEGGTDIVAMQKVVERENGVLAVLCEHPTLGSQWVSFSHVLAVSVEIGKRVELTWQWSSAGYYEAVEVRPAPKMSDFDTKEIF